MKYHYLSCSKGTTFDYPLVSSQILITPWYLHTFDYPLVSSQLLITPWYLHSLWLPIGIFTTFDYPNDQRKKDKEWPIKLCTEYQWLDNTYLTKNREWTLVFWKDKQFLLLFLQILWQVMKEEIKRGLWQMEYICVHQPDIVTNICAN
jgi:hypothetical protein